MAIKLLKEEWAVYSILHGTYKDADIKLAVVRIELLQLI
jgi:hypothetical protein